MTINLHSLLEISDTRNAFGAIGVGAVLIWPHARSLRIAIAIQCVGSAGLSIYFALGGSTTAAVSCALAMMQLVAAAVCHDRTRLTAVYLASLIMLGLCVMISWEGWPSVLIGSGTLLATYARMQDSTFRMKKWFLIGSPFWLVHNIITASYFALVIDALAIVSSGWSVLEDDRKISVFTWPKKYAAAL